MQAVDTSLLDIYVAFSNRRGNDPLHWILLLAHPGSDRCTWYHVTGGPTQGRPYVPKIEANKRTNSFGIATKQFISRIPAGEINKVKAATQAVPLQRCQRWTTEVLAKLEEKVWCPLALAPITTVKSNHLALRTWGLKLATLFSPTSARLMYPHICRAYVASWRRFCVISSRTRRPIAGKSIVRGQSPIDPSA
jgi:hypothetical protein